MKAAIGVCFATWPKKVEEAPRCIHEISPPGAPTAPEVAATAEVFEHLLGFTPEPLSF